MILCKICYHYFDFVEVPPPLFDRKCDWGAAGAEPGSTVGDREEDLLGRGFWRKSGA